MLSLKQNKAYELMAILNMTPDSFYDGGKYSNIAAAREYINQSIKAGANIIDIGGESTRPGALPVTTEVELARVLPIVELCKQEFDQQIIISIDTSNPIVMQETLAAGANWINDVRSFINHGTFKILRQYKPTVCIMHMLGSCPQTMQLKAQQKYHNKIFTKIILDEFLAQVIQDLKNRTQVLLDLGLEPAQIIIDPGFGFGKLLQQNLYLLQNLSVFKSEFPQHKILIGISRKYMFGELLNCPLEERVYPSIVAATMAYCQNIDIFRVHDVAATRYALDLVQAFNCTFS